ncbi:hypothetical protein [Streptomyces sp. KL116D]|uniref:hypothetical protein n=1 Tax=Streptomyces sp. KL116D TaxID=3045152 RepID=UPI0035578E3F
MAVVQALGSHGHRDGRQGARRLRALAEFSILLVFGLVTLIKGGGPRLGAADSFSRRPRCRALASR